MICRVFACRAFFAGLVLTLWTGAALAQGALLPFGTSQPDRDAPVQVDADTLSVDQDTGQAVFEGNVSVVQGDIRLAANRVFVVYKTDEAGIERLEAEGDVILVNGEDAAEAAKAVYNIDTGDIEMTGNVLLMRGQNAVRAQQMNINLNDGTATMSGRVTTVLNPGDN